MRIPSILFLVQAVTESLPISSSGHCMLVSRFVSQRLPATITEWWYEAAHLANAFATTLFWLHYWWPLLDNFLLAPIEYMHYPLYFLIAVGVPVAVYFLTGQLIQPIAPLFFGFFSTIVILLFVPSVPVFINDPWSWQAALLIGCGQAVALFFPGLSRLALVYAAVLSTNRLPIDALAVAFLVQLPIMFAGGIRGYYRLLWRSKKLFSVSWSIGLLLLGTLSAYGALMIIYYAVLYAKLWLFALYLSIPLVISFIRWMNDETF